MVNGVSGVGAGVNIDALKEIIQDVVEETLEAKETQSANSVEEIADEESELVDVEQVADKQQEVPYENKLSGLTGLVTTMSEIMMSIMSKMMEMLGIGQGENTTTAGSTDQSSNTSDKYVMSEDEKAFLTLHPDFVKNIVAEEKFEEKYGREAGRNIGSGKLKIIRKTDAIRLKVIKQNITDEEIQAYLQLNPNVIKDAIAKGQ